MYSFRNDYSEGAAPEVLEALLSTNLTQTVGYGMDAYCAEATQQLQDLCQAPDAKVFFTVGGTQTNVLVIHSFLRPFEAVISPFTGHIAVHETGAVEATGHKICTVQTPDGKLTPALIEGVVNSHSSEHMVVPKLVYISDSTEIGTVYTKAELEGIRACCDANGLYLYIDGARIASALMASDVTMADLARISHAFTFGGTKNGLLFGEAVVVAPDVDTTYFRHHMKQQGVILAKGRLLGIQFSALLKDNLWQKLASHANQLSDRVREGTAALGCEFLVETTSNQTFIWLDNAVVAALQAKGYQFEVEGLPTPTRTCIRIITSWATPAEAVETFLKDLKGLL